MYNVKYGLKVATLISSCKTSTLLKKNASREICTNPPLSHAETVRYPWTVDINFKLLNIGQKHRPATMSEIDL